ncbi:hypothetical protein AAG906_006641 [Vitis piasezkii]
MAIWASGWRRFKGLNHVSFGLRRVVKSKAMKGAESIKKEILWLGKRWFLVEKAANMLLATARQSNMLLLTPHLFHFHFNKGSLKEKHMSSDKGNPLYLPPMFILAGEALFLCLAHKQKRMQILKVFL